jgi:hypothetical protein
MKRNVLGYLITIGLTAGAVVLIVGFGLMTSRTKASGVLISPKGSVPEGVNAGTVLFYVTNGEPRLVHLACLEVQVTSSNGWKTISTEQSAMFNPGAPSYQWAGGLLAGSYRTFYVQPPVEGRWRVRLTYLRQERGLYSFLVRAETLIGRLRGPFTWSSLFLSSRGNIFRLADQHQVLSQEFSE